MTFALGLSSSSFFCCGVRLSLGVLKASRSEPRIASGNIARFFSNVSSINFFSFASRASLLILDEPTGSLDARARERFFALFEAVAPETTLLLCSHRLDEIRPLVDHVLLLEEGRLAYDGPAREFLARSALATVDVWVDGEEAEAWLAARGFRRSPAGVWRRTLDPAEKMKLMPELLRELGPRVLNVNARDLEALELASHARGHGDD